MVAVVAVVEQVKQDIVELRQSMLIQVAVVMDYQQH
jgi:hypothetical protein